MADPNCGKCGGDGEIACSSTHYEACPECATADPFESWTALDHALYALRLFARRHELVPRFKKADSKRQAQTVSRYRECVGGCRRHIQAARSKGFEGSAVAQLFERNGEPLPR